MSLVRPFETSWELSNWKQGSKWIPDSSEIFTQSSAGCALLYPTGSQGQTAQALGHLWLMAPDRAGFKQMALRDTAVPNSHSLELFLCAQALNCILRLWCSSLTKMHFKAVPDTWQVSRGAKGLWMRFHLRRDIPAHKQGRVLIKLEPGSLTGWRTVLCLRTDFKVSWQCHLAANASRATWKKAIDITSQSLSALGHLQQVVFRVHKIKYNRFPKTYLQLVVSLL